MKKRSEFKVCFSSKGWELISEEKSKLIDQRDAMISEKINAILKERSTFCKSDEYKIWYKKSPCDIDFIQDNSLISDAEIKVGKELSSRFNSTSIDIIELYKQYDLASTDEYANIWNSYNEETQANMSNLFEKKLTWYKFNLKKKELANIIPKKVTEVKARLKLIDDRDKEMN